MDLVIAMDEKVDLPQASFDPAADPVHPCIDAGMIGGMPAVGYKTDKGNRRRQSHVYGISPAGRIGDHAADPQLTKKLPGIPCGAGNKPALLAQLYAGEEITGQLPEITMQ